MNDKNQLKKRKQIWDALAKQNLTQRLKKHITLDDTQMEWVAVLTFFYPNYFRWVTHCSMVTLKPYFKKMAWYVHMYNVHWFILTHLPTIKRFVSIDYSEWAFQGSTFTLDRRPFLAFGRETYDQTSPVDLCFSIE